MTNFELYWAACRADDRYHNLLVGVYGAKNAGDARYLPRHADPSLELARSDKRIADAAWHAEMLKLA